MTDGELAAIKARSDGSGDNNSDVPALLAEIERLNYALTDAQMTQDYDRGYEMGVAAGLKLATERLQSMFLAQAESDVMTPEELAADIPESSWVWCGYAGHFIASRHCVFHLTTRVGDYRISTIGDYYPYPGNHQVDVGLGRKYETFVFAVTGHGEHGEGEVVSWSDELECKGYQTSEDAEVGHMSMCFKYACAR